MKHSKESRKRMINFVLAKVIYYIILPFMYLRKFIVEGIIKIRFQIAKRKADAMHRESGKKHYVLMGKRKFYVFNKTQLQAAAKKYRKRSGHTVEWKHLYCYESSV